MQSPRRDDTEPGEAREGGYGRGTLAYVGKLEVVGGEGSLCRSIEGSRETIDDTESLSTDVRSEKQAFLIFEIRKIQK